MVQIHPTEVTNIPHPYRQVICKSASGPLAVGDCITLYKDDGDNFTRVAVIRNLKRYNGIPEKERPDLDSEKRKQNIKDNGGYYLLAQWFYVVVEYDGLAEVVAANNTQRSNNATTLLTDREVILSNYADWMPFVDVVDVIEVHHWTHLEHNLLDIQGRAQVYWLRYWMRVGSRVRNSELVSINDWDTFLEELYPAIANYHETLPYRRHQLVETVAAEILTILSTRSERGSNCQHRSFPILDNDFRYLVKHRKQWVRER